jgi:hypothetical protein
VAFPNEEKHQQYKDAYLAVSLKFKAIPKKKEREGTLVTFFKSKKKQKQK